MVVVISCFSSVLAGLGTHGDEADPTQEIGTTILLEGHVGEESPRDLHHAGEPRGLEVDPAQQGVAIGACPHGHHHASAIHLIHVPANVAHRLCLCFGTFKLASTYSFTP